MHQVTETSSVNKTTRRKASVINNRIRVKRTKAKKSMEDSKINIIQKCVMDINMYLDTVLYHENRENILLSQMHPKQLQKLVTNIIPVI